MMIVIDSGVVHNYKMRFNNFNLSYSGGYITQRFYNQPKINAIQIEIAKYIRTERDLTNKIVHALISAILSSIHN